MKSLLGHSRRAFVAATAALAAAPAVEAKNKKKKRKKKRKPPAPPPPPPLTTALMTVTSVTDIGSSVTCGMAGVWKHLASGESSDLSFSTVVPMESTGDAMQAFLITSLQGAISLELAIFTLDVPPERIAVTLI